MLTILIPTYNSAHILDRTLDSIFMQEERGFSIIVIDATSSDRTLNIVKMYDPERIKVLTVGEYSFWKMVNWGLYMADSEYITVLFPGDFYLMPTVFSTMYSLIEENRFPNLVYSNALVYPSYGEPIVALRPYHDDWLRQGFAPTPVQGVWFKVSTLLAMGKFDEAYWYRSGFDAMCRLHLDKEARFAFTEKVLVSLEHPKETSYFIFAYAKETLNILYRHFGWKSALRWLMGLEHMMYVKQWLRLLKSHILGK